MTARVGYVLSALLLGVGALVGVQYSSATFTDDSNTPAQVTAARDWTPPSVSVDDPGFVIHGIVSIIATAADVDTSVGSVTIQYRLEGDSTWELLCVDDDGSPWDCTWDTETDPDGIYELRAIATDVDGNTDTSATITTEVYNTPGVVIDPVPSPVRGIIRLTAYMVNVGSGSSTITFRATATGTNNWVDLPGCTNLTGPNAYCDFNTALGASGATYDLMAVGWLDTTQYDDVQTGILVDNTAPTVSLTVPAGALGGTVVLDATAGDPISGVSSVLFESRRQGLGNPWVSCSAADTVAPFSCDLDTTTMSDGSAYEFRATAEDGAGNTTTTPLQSRVIDNTDPSLSFTPPSGTLSGSLNLAATASDSGSGMASVAFQYQAQGAGTWEVCGGAPDTSSPYGCILNTTTLTNGTYLFRAVATDNAGRTTTSSPGTATVSNHSLDLATLPAYLNASATAYPLSATWSGPTAATVRFERSTNGTTWTVTSLACASVTANPTAACSWNAAALANGTYYVRASATVSSIFYEDVQTVIVDKTVPTVPVLTVPAAPVSGTFQLSATGSDANSGMASVLFQYKLSTSGTWLSCGSDSSSPYNCSMDATTLTDANYDFRATSTDAAGNTRNSATTTRAVNTAVSSVSVTSPADGATVMAPTTMVTADATSTKPITSVALQYRATGSGTWLPLCTANSAPYACPWNTGSLSPGSYQLQAILTQANTYTVTSTTVSVTVKRIRGVDLLASGGTNQGRPGDGDVIQLSYEGDVTASSLMPGWNGASPTGISVTMKDQAVPGALVTGRDYMAFGAANLGQVAFSLDYVDPDRTVTFGNATMARSTVVSGGVTYTVVTIELGAPTASANRLNDLGNTTQTMQWTPSAVAADAAGNVCDTTLVTESGAVDADL